MAIWSLCLYKNWKHLAVEEGEESASRNKQGEDQREVATFCSITNKQTKKTNKQTNKQYIYIYMHIYIYIYSFLWYTSSSTILKYLQVVILVIIIIKKRKKILSLRALDWGTIDYFLKNLNFSEDLAHHVGR